MNEQWYYTENGQQRGPIGAQELRQLAASGKLQPTDQVWREGMKTWQRASSVPEILPNLAAGAAPPPLPFHVGANAIDHGARAGNPYQSPRGCAAAEQPGSGGATAGFVLGLLSLVAWILPIAGFPVSGIGLYMSIKGRNSPQGGLAIAGIVLNSIGLLLSFINSALGVYLAVQNMPR